MRLWDQAGIERSCLSNLNTLTMLRGWRLGRSPLHPAVPLEGSDTVTGLRTLERLRSANLLNNGGASTSGRGGQPPQASRRQSYQRFKGPFVEKMSAEDLQKNPKPWKQFFGDGDRGWSAGGFNVPASVDVLSERTEENIATYLPNYVRLAGAVILLTFYLRPKALLGAAAVAYTLYTSITRTMDQQRQQQTAETAGAGGVPPPRRPAQDNPQDQLLAAVTMIGTWIIVAYTHCFPIIVLSMLLASAAVFLHAATRRGASEYRYKGRALLGFTFMQVLGRQPVPPGSDPCKLFKQLGHGTKQAVEQQALHLARWAKFYLLGAWDAVKRPFSRPAGGRFRSLNSWE